MSVKRNVTVPPGSDAMRVSVGSRRVNAAAPDPRRWKALLLICTAIFVVVLDVAIVNVALPSIGRDLGFAERTSSG